MLPSSRTSRVRASWTNVLRIVFSSVFLTLLCGIAFATSGSSGAGAKPPAGGAQFINPPTLNIHPIARVTQAVDNNKRSTIHGQTSPLIGSGRDLGRLNSSTQLDHMIMVLQASTDQDHALTTLIDQQLDSGHANFHHWLTPDEFGAALGVADSDIQQVTDWLSSEGFTVEQVAPGKRFIQFSGSSAQVESAFQTEMHRYTVNGDNHISNSTDISVPDALRPVIAGVPTLNDFFKTSDMKGAHKTTLRDASSTGNAPMLDVSNSAFSPPDYTNGTTHFVGAGDFATIYNTVPLLTTGNDGTGVTVGIIARTDISLTDVQMYRTLFALKNNDPVFVVAGEDPGVVPGDDGESYLDVEVSGGAAPGATIEFITSRATLVTDGVDLSAMYAVQNNLTDIISESYGQCEANFSAAGESFYVNLWAQAAAQGQSVFVSSGDNGPAGCDNSNSSFSSFGYAVSALASTPYNVAVGGTIFAEGAGTYWGTAATIAPPFASALGYIPETPWNESKGSGATGAAGLWSGSGGISAYITTPSWQTGFGVPVTDPAYPNGVASTPAAPFVPGPHRYMPDVALAAAADHDGTLYCGEGICQLSSTGSLVNAGIVGGTSVAAPSMAGIQALVNQYNGGRQGQPNYVYYALADAQHTAGLACQSNSATLDPNCAFHDITTGNTLICGNSSCAAGNKLGWTAVPGYDLATGLGSPNASSLATLWSTVTFRSTTTTLALSQTTGLNHGQAVTASGTVAPGSGTGVPTGQVSFLVSSGALGDPVDPDAGGFLNDVPLATLDGSGNYSIDLSNLPGGTYTVVARYGGDTTFASSTSAPTQVTVSSETATVTISPNAFNGTACTETAQTSFNYGAYVWTDVTVTGVSGQGVPTGTVTITDNGNPLVTSTLNASGLAHFLSGAIPTTSCVSGYTFQDTAPLVVGTHVLGATYSGDASFATAAATPVTVTVNQSALTGTISAGSTNIASGDQVLLTLTLAGISGAGPGTLSPTGMVTFTDTTTAANLGTAPLSGTSTFGGIATLTTNSITAAGANSIVASWSGDANYSGGTTATAVTVTVQAGTSTSVAVTSNTNPSVIGGRPTFTATMTPTTVTSGSVKFYDSFSGQPVLLGTGTVGAAHTATFRPAAAANLPAGVHTITAIYGGNATFNDSQSPGFSQTFSQLTTSLQLSVLGSGTCSQQFGLQATLGTTIAATPVSGTATFFDGSTQIATAPFTTVAASGGGFGLFTSQVEVTVAPGSHMITAQLSDTNYTAPVSNTQTITSSCTVPSITSAFSPTTIAIGNTSTLSFTISNPNVGPMTGVTFTDTLPLGLAVATQNNLTNTCGGSVVVDAGSGSITLSGGSISASGQCSVSVNVQGNALGMFTNTTSAVSADASGSGNSTTASLTVISPPTLAEAFGLSNIQLGSSTTLQFTVQNTNATTTLTGIGFTDTLPAGLEIASPNGLSSGAGDCQSSSGTVIAAAGSNSISLSGVTLSASNSCTFSVVVTAIQTGTQTNVTNNITSNETPPGNSASASVTVFIAGALSGNGTATPNSGIVGTSVQLNVAVTAGTNPASTGIAVTADLTSIGGGNSVAFTDNGDGTYTLNTSVGATAVVGTQSIPVTITDSQGRTATTNIAFTVLAQGSLSGTGVAAPSAVAAGQSTIVLLMVSVTPGTNPPSTNVIVTADLSSIGGSATQQFFDDGTNGDQIAHDGVYTFATRIPADVALGIKTLPVTITDDQSRTANTTIQLDVDDVIFADGFETL